MFASLVILLILPYVDFSNLRGMQDKPLAKIIFFIFIANFIVLMQLGGKHVETPFIEFGQISTFIYFSYFLVLIPLVSIIENYMIYNK
jgi:ubiquinol-cytochrome c reductase cytochrome b subunit